MHVLCACYNPFPLSQFEFFINFFTFFRIIYFLFFHSVYFRFFEIVEIFELLNISGSFFGSSVISTYFYRNIFIEIIEVRTLIFYVLIQNLEHCEKLYHGSSLPFSQFCLTSSLAFINIDPAMEFVGKTALFLLKISKVSYSSKFSVARSILFRMLTTCDLQLIVDFARSNSCFSIKDKLY